MNFNYLIILLIVLCSILSVAETNFVKNKKYLFWNISFYFSIYLFVLSLMKYLLGYHKENLIESFWNTKIITLVHYGIPLVIMAIIMPIILNLLFKENVVYLIRYFDSSLYFVLSLVFLLVRKMNNLTYCISFSVAAMVTLAAVVLKRIRAVYTGRIDIKNRIIEAFPVLICYFMTVVVYTPNELYLYNASDFPMSYWYFFWKLLLAGIIAVTVLMIGILLYLNETHIKFYITIMFALLAAGYIQGMFFNGNMAVLDGTNNNKYDNLDMCINISIWVILITAVIIFSVKRSDIAKKFMNVISIWITLIQVVSLAVIIITSNGTASKSEAVLTTDGMLEIGDKNNVIVFVLDKFDGSYVDEILEETPDFFEPLNDFVFYENATSMFCPTYDSIPYLLTGTEYQGGVK